MANPRVRLQLVSLMRGSKPVKYETKNFEGMSIEEVEEHKKTNCRRYDNCLDHAASLNWRGFSCSECWVNEPLSSFAQRSDVIGLADLLKEIMSSHGYSWSGMSRAERYHWELRINAQGGGHGSN